MPISNRSIVRRRLVVACLMAAVVALGSACDQIGIGPEGLDNPAATMFRANAQRTGVYDTPGLAQYEALKWQFEAQDWIFGAPAVAGETVVAVSYDGFVYALDRETGEEKWRFQTGDAILASPAISGDTVFVASSDRNIYALDIATGDVRWQVAGDGVYSGSPAVVGDTLYVDSDAGLLLALDTATGDERWRFATDGDPMPFSMAVSDGIVYTITGGGILYALDAASGEERWRLDTSENLADRYSPTATPVVDGGTIYLMLTNLSGETVLQALALETRTISWQYKAPAESFSAPSIANGRLFFGSLNGNIYGLQAETGEELWVLPTQEPIFSAAAITDNTVYIGSTDNYLYALDGSTGLVLWRFRARGAPSSPAIADRVVYVGDDAGVLYAIR